MLASSNPGKAFLCLCVLLFAAVSSALGQGPGPVVHYLGSDKGLSNNSVNTIFQDHNGFLWFGTYDGLNRYDGYQFRVFRNIIGDTTSLPSNNINSIAEDGDRNLWVGGHKGISIYTPSTARFAPARFVLLNGQQVTALNDNSNIIRTLKDGTVLAGTQHHGLFVFPKGAQVGRQVPLSGTGAYDVSSLVYDGVKNLAYVFVQNKGLFIYNPGTGRLQLKSGAIQQGYCLERDRQGNIWLGNGNGLYRFNEATGGFSQNITPQVRSVVDLCEDRNGALWIASNGDGLWVLPPDRQQASLAVGSNGRPLVNSNAVYSVYEDQEGRKWVGTLRGGINVVDARSLPFRHIVYEEDKANLVNNFILSFCEDEKHNLWIGTDGAGLRYWDRPANRYRNFLHNPADPSSLSSNFVTSVLRDAAGDTWVATWFGGINRLRKGAAGFEHYRCYNPVTHSNDNHIWLLFEDAQKRLWASASAEGSLYLLNRQTHVFECFDPSLTNLQCLAQDAGGTLWGGDYASLVRLDPVNKKHKVFNIGYTVRSIHEDRQQNFWVGTQDGGLLLFDRKSGQYRRFTTADGLPSNTILRIIEDGRGYLWLSTFNGLSRFHPPTRSFRNFSRSDGLQSNEFSFNGALALASGELAFGGIRGFNLFHPDSIRNERADLKLFLAGLRVANEEVLPGGPYVTKQARGQVQEITVPFDRAVLSLDYLALLYSGADQVRYAYTLKGWDRGWNYVQATRTANYSRLREGTYTFQVKGTHPGTGWSPEVSLVKVIVLPPWYRSWWAYLLYVSLGAGLVFVYILYKNKQARLEYEVKLAQVEAQKEKELHENKIAFFTNISHEFRTPLTLILNPVKDLVQKGAEGGSALLDELKGVYRNAHRLLRLVDQLLLFRKVESETDRLHVAPFDMVALCREVYEHFVQQAKRKNIRFPFLHAMDSLEVYGDYGKLEMALFNLLSNAFKFTPEGGTIALELVEAAATVRLSVRDTGPGIPEGAEERIFEKFRQATAGESKHGFGIGLYLVRHFVQSHGGRITCTSRPGEGAAFDIELKKGKDHFDGALVSDCPAPSLSVLPEPLPEEEALAAPQPEPLPEGLSAGEVVTEKKSILFVDDNEEIRQYLRRVLEGRYLFYDAPDGLQGLERARQLEPDLIISDVNMEGLNGLELCAAIKKDEELSHIPVILLTASLAAEMKLKGVESGADEYITKPFEQELLLAKIQNILANRDLLQRYFFDKITLKESSVKVPDAYRDFIKKCIDTIEAHMGNDDFNVKKLSQLMGMSHSLLYKKVKAVSGQSITSFITSVKLRRAAVLMLSGDTNISEASFQVGMKDRKFFREKFVQVFGMNPSDYVKKYRPAFNKDLNAIRPL
ncbi:two-component regulator propeller domain-containing protein [Paraflavisolibacter sp. H34]|uniref:hybrid sensor histidine kinase/response regulator transcription factor n=1 Tax=Huijunlia imazamoxiresistens TaxID=3127457 RepID=UPI00301A220E